MNDIQLVWDNCHTYNPPLNQITKYAQFCEKKFKKEFLKTFKFDIEINESFSHENIGINEKLELKEKIKELIVNEDYRALNNLKNYCLKIVPHIIEIDKENKKFNIIFDKMNRYIYEKIYEIINL